MLKYKIFYAQHGLIYNAAANGVIDEDYEFVSVTEAYDSLCSMHGLDKSLHYVILPVVKFTNNVKTLDK